MITIYQGTQAQIDHYFHTNKTENTTLFFLYDNSEFPKGWTGLRSLLKQLETVYGEKKVYALLEQHKAIAAFIIPEMMKRFSKEDTTIFHYFRARLESRLNVPYELFEKLAALLEQLTIAFNFTLIIPDMTALDAESMRVLENYYRYHTTTTAHSLELQIGFATDKKDRADSNGIAWKPSEGIRQYLYGSFVLYDNTKIIHLATATNTTLSKEPSWKRQELPNKESKLFHTIHQSPGTTAIASIITQMNSSYDRFSFRAVIQLGLKTLEQYPELDNNTKAEIHGLIGSAANYYQFSHHGNPPFDAFLAYHFSEALAIEKRPEIRSALLYRITFTYAERMERLDKALFWGEKAIIEAYNHTLPNLQKNYHKAWAHTVRAEVYAHSGRFEDFVLDAQKAYTLFEEGIKTIEHKAETVWNPWYADYNLSLFNVAIHQVYTGDELSNYDYSRKWYTKMPEVMKKIPKLMVFDTFHWVDYHRNKFEFNATVTAAQKGIKDAITYKHGQIYVYEFCAADMYYRMGNATKALEFFEKAAKRRPIYDDIFHDISMNWLLGCTHLKLQQYDQAKLFFEKELAITEIISLQIKIRCQLAIIATYQQQQKNSDEQINQAIDLAVALGEQNMLILVSSTAGQIASLRNDLDTARSAYTQALELYASFSNSGLEIQPAVLLSLYMGYMKIHEPKIHRVADCIKILPEALDQADSWWYIPQLQAYANSYKNVFQDDLSLEKGLETLAIATIERIDCNETLEVL